MAKRKRKKGGSSGSGPGRIKSRIKRGITTAGKKIRRTAERRSSKDSRDATSARRTVRSSRPPTNSRDKQRTKPKLDIGKGRLVYPRKGDDGRVRYLPRESAASRDEIRKGLFIKMAAKEAREIDPGLARKFDAGKGRYIYPVKDIDGKVSYLPRESEASSVEKENGAFVKDKIVVQKVAENLKAKYDIGKGRYIFPVEGANGKVEYLPKQDDANDFELSNGLFVKNDDVEGKEPVAERRIRRIKRHSKQKPKPPFTDDQGRRNLKTRPITEAKDGTELWNMKEIPEIEIEIERKLLLTLKPKYDLGKGRMIYPVINEKGQTIYLPLKHEATKKEMKQGVFADFIPKEGLSKFIKDNINKKELEVEGGEIKAVTKDDFKTAFNSLTDFVLKQHKGIVESIESDPALQQEWV
jgi:hypothetical protein